ncbi:hypothetical protein HBB16_15810 [Pseudonocardia sp. MCCB 268]|nr:hypothetical protein [Pseudonocardia cytotoxica]
MPDLSFCGVQLVVPVAALGRGRCGSASTWPAGSTCPRCRSGRVRPSSGWWMEGAPRAGTPAGQHHPRSRCTTSTRCSPTWVRASAGAGGWWVAAAGETGAYAQVAAELMARHQAGRGPGGTPPVSAR